MSDETKTITLTVNGDKVTKLVDARQHLVDFLRGELALTGSHLGCEHGICGACSVRLDGDVVRGCLILAIQADGTNIETVEGLTASGEIADLQENFVERDALQCGFCTPGFVMATVSLLDENSDPSEQEIREGLEGNLCRCTGYHNIVRAVQSAAGQEVSA